MKVFTVSFFGHREIENPIAIEQALESLIGRLLREKEYVTFLVGREGDFDLLAASAVHRCKRIIRPDNSALVWVMPYLTAEYRGNEEAFRAYYDEFDLCEAAAGRHFKAAFQTRNRFMVDRSDLAVFCVQRGKGGARQTMRYAQSRSVPCVNLGRAPKRYGIYPEKGTDFD